MRCPKCSNEINSGVKFCPECGGSIITANSCPSCGSNIDAGAQFCGKCGAPTGMNTGTLGRRGTGHDTKEYAQGKSPGVALVLSLLIVGLGQFYNGDIKKGAVMLGVAIFAGVISVGILWVVIAIGSAVDAYRVAAQKTPLWK